MAENSENGADDETTVEPTAPSVDKPVDTPADPPVDQTVPAGAVPVPASSRPRLRDTVYSFRALLAVGVATLLLGGAGGAAIVALAQDDHDMVRINRFGGPRFDGPHMNGPGFRNDGPRFRNGGPQEPGSGTTPQPAPGSAS